MHQILYTPLSARLVALAWPLLPAGALAAAAFARNVPTAGWIMAALGLAGAAWLWLWTGRPATITPEALQLQGGRVLALRRVIRRQALIAAVSLATPGLRLAGCRLALVFTVRGMLVLPPLPAADAALVLEWAAK